MNRRAIFLLLILVLVLAPAANAWCSTVCLAAAISSGCAHNLQPTDDLPMDKAASVFLVSWSGAAALAPAAMPSLPVFVPVAEQRAPLRL
ncbi:MAG: hypothetical protein HYX27_26305 [Acidobacteria bacterium]|nr:hypothetical protein [Acidobacteriota bacterium]